MISKSKMRRLMNINIPGILLRLRRKFKSVFKSAFVPKKPVLGRVACLGQSVISARSSIFYNPVLINQQKTRCDLFLDWINGAPRPVANSVKKHLNRDYVLPWIEEQERLPWIEQRGNVRLLLMDSFSELTDQKFTHKKEGWSFACHYNDLIHTPEFSQQFDCFGLLPIDQIEESFSRFFVWFFNRHPGAVVLFLHFPTKFDSRIHFCERAVAIKEIMERISSRHPSIRNISLSDDRVEQSTVDVHPYHFSEQTVNAFVEEWKRSLR
jgi:hypothetical protein